MPNPVEKVPSSQMRPPAQVRTLRSERLKDLVKVTLIAALRGQMLVPIRTE